MFKYQRASTLKYSFLTSLIKVFENNLCGRFSTSHSAVLNVKGKKTDYVEKEMNKLIDFTLQYDIEPYFNNGYGTKK